MCRNMSRCRFHGECGNPITRARAKGGHGFGPAVEVVAAGNAEPGSRLRIASLDCYVSGLCGLANPSNLGFRWGWGPPDNRHGG
jgi:hypothetical protein